MKIVICGSSTFRDKMLEYMIDNVPYDDLKEIH